MSVAGLHPLRSAAVACVLCVLNVVGLHPFHFTFCTLSTIGGEMSVATQFSHCCKTLCVVCGECSPVPFPLCTLSRDISVAGFHSLRSAAVFHTITFCLYNIIIIILINSCLVKQSCL